MQVPSKLSHVRMRNKFSTMLLSALYTCTTRTFGRGYQFAVRNTIGRLPWKTAIAEFADGSRIQFDISDFYWNRLALKQFRYEPEIEIVLLALKDVDFVLLDCGANIGYWSVLASSKPFGAKHCIAVEASPSTFEKLKENFALNANRFAVLNRALYSETGIPFAIGDAIHHAGAYVKPIARDGLETESVSSITIDDLVRDQGVDPAVPLVIKLDVEGQEVNALHGAEQALSRDYLLVYEDHYKERNHAPTAHILNELGAAVYYVTEDGRAKRITDLAQMDGIKIRRHKGYNFFACPDESRFTAVLEVMVR